MHSITSAAAYYTGLTSITLPDSLQEVGRRALYGCKALSSIEVSAANPCLTVQDGILYNKAMTQLIRCPAAGGLTAYTVPASVTELAEGAFASCTSLESIVLPEGMTSIADNAFEGCSALREVTLPSTLKTLNYACFGLVQQPDEHRPAGRHREAGLVGLCQLHQPVVRDHPQQCENDRRLRIQ